jgi:hypothetical protein
MFYTLKERGMLYIIWKCWLSIGPCGYYWVSTTCNQSKRNIKKSWETLPISHYREIVKTRERERGGRRRNQRRRKCPRKKKLKETRCVFVVFSE